MSRSGFSPIEGWRTWTLEWNPHADAAVCLSPQIKCAQYWPSPERETEIYEEFIVKLSSEDHCPDYTVRHLCVTNVSLGKWCTRCCGSNAVVLNWWSRKNYIYFLIMESRHKFIPAPPKKKTW